MCNIISFPGAASGLHPQNGQAYEILTRTKLVTLCSFHHLKVSLLALGRGADLPVAADAVAVIDWATAQLDHISSPDEDSFARLKKLAEIVHYVGSYVELTGEYGPSRRGAADPSPG